MRLSADELIMAKELVANALKEDLGPSGDITTRALMLQEKMVKARIISRQDCVVCGLQFAELAFRMLDPDVSYIALVEDGESVAGLQTLAEIEGRAGPILSAERTALNFLSHLSGIATAAFMFSKQLEGTRASVVDTRKTHPLLRFAEKYAVRCGGCQNHRSGLFDGVLIKDNHIVAAGSITKAIKAVKTRLGPLVKIEVEAASLDEVKEALDAGADVIMLDNMSLEEIKTAVKIVGGKVLLEVSGNVSLESVREIASLGVDFISSSKFVMGAQAVDMSLEFISVTD